MPPSQTPAGPVGALRVAAVALLAALAFLPIANWIPGGHDVDWYATALTLWTLGAAIVAGSAVVLAIVAGRYGAAFLPLGRRLAALPRPSPRLAAALLVLAAFAVYALVATDVFSRRPLLIDLALNARSLGAHVIECGGYADFSRRTLWPDKY